MVFRQVIWCEKRKQWESNKVLGLCDPDLTGSNIQNNLIEHHTTDLIVFFFQIKAFFKCYWIVFVELIVARAFVLELKIMVKAGLTHFNFNIWYFQWSWDLRKDFDCKLIELIYLDRRVLKPGSCPKQMTSSHYSKQLLRFLATFTHDLVVLNFFNKFY